MRYSLLGVLLMTGSCIFGQGGYYVSKDGDTIRCQFKKVLPRTIKVKTEKGTTSFEAEEIRGFLKDGVPFESKKIKNQKEYAYIFLPNDTIDREYQYDKEFSLMKYDWIRVNLVMMSGKGVKFYELTEWGSSIQYGKGVTNFYIENDSLGLTKVPRMQAIGGNVEKTDVINALYNYLSTDEATEKKLSVNEDWQTFNYKGIRKLIAGFMGKEFIED